MTNWLISLGLDSVVKWGLPGKLEVASLSECTTQTCEGIADSNMVVNDYVENCKKLDFIYQLLGSAMGVKLNE